ncbi:metal-binding protein [Streptomyces sp. LMG1-1-1.1]|uniref:metal-binding protein n=1 Tax=Streptomyces sp. LMG1-1-1.1 TaxID=3135245 RepID=UPI0039C8D46B
MDGVADTGNSASKGGSAGTGSSALRGGSAGTGSSALRGGSAGTGSSALRGGSAGTGSSAGAGGSAGTGGSALAGGSAGTGSSALRGGSAGTGSSALRGGSAGTGSSALTGGSALTGSSARTGGSAGTRSSAGAATGSASGGSPGGRSGVPAARGSEAHGLSVGAARAGALLDRQLTLARTRAHSAALQALGSARFHAVADALALLASEVPLGPLGSAPAVEVLDGPAEAAERRLLDAVAALPLTRAAHPYNAEALGLGAGETQDAPWHQTRLLLRLHRYASEALHTGGEPDSALYEAARALDRHRDAAEAATAAATAARTPRIAPATAYALGVLHADQRHEVEAARFAFQHAWHRTTAPVP